MSNLRRNATFKLQSRYFSPALSKNLQETFTITNHRFCIFLDNEVSRPRTLNDCLSQGPVLAPILFNISHKQPSPDFIIEMCLCIVDDIILSAQAENLSIIEYSLTKNLKTMEEYFLSWQLKPNSTGTIVSAFHLNN